jgi:hypothetical protein
MGRDPGSDKHCHLISTVKRILFGHSTGTLIKIKLKTDKDNNKSKYLAETVQHCNDAVPPGLDIQAEIDLLAYDFF